MRASEIITPLQQDCCSADPRVALTAMRLIEEGREWLADCEWANVDGDYFETLGAEAIVRGVSHHYVGGWAAFVAASA